MPFKKRKARLLSTILGVAEHRAFHPAPRAVMAPTIDFSVGSSLTFSGSATVPEDTAPSSSLGTFSVSGGSGSYTYAITAGNGAGKFSVSTATLVLAGALDYETTTSYALTVTADNGVDPVLTLSLTLNVGDVLDTAATLTSPTGTQTGDTTATGTVSTNQASGTMYAVVTTSATPPTATQVKAGQNNAGSAAAFAGSAAATLGTNTINATGLSGGTTYYFYFAQENTVPLKSSVAASASFTTTGSSHSAEAIAFIGRTSGLNGTDQSAIYAFIDTLVSAGVFAKFDIAYIIGAPDATTAGLNLVSSSYTLTAVGSPTFTAYKGYTGGASKRLDTNWNPATNGVAYTQNSAHIGVRTNNTISPETAYAIGNSIAATYSHIIIDLGGAMYPRIGDGSGAATGRANTVSKGLFIANRSGAATEEAYANNATSIGSDTKASGAPDSRNLWIMDSNQASGLTNLPSGNEFCFASAGGSLTSGDVSTLLTALNTLGAAFTTPWP